MTGTVTGGPHTDLAAHGLRVRLPARWEGRLYLRNGPGSEADESVNPILHLANFALPPGRGDFGTGAVERMREQHVFMALVEYDTEELGSALFAPRGLPRLALRDFAPNALQRRLPGQLGCQRFFTANDRPFCLYSVLGSRPHAAALLAEARDVLDRLEVGRR